MNDIVLQSRDLTKRYGQFVAVDTLNLAIRRGEVFGLLGPNGAGKTTTILMLLGLTEPTSGDVEVLGLNPARKPLSVKARVGYLPDQVGFYDDMTARENLAYIAKLNGLRRDAFAGRIEAVLKQMGLGAVMDKRVGTFSRGMRQRLGLAEILLKQPELIIMDEPTLGLDPEAAHEFLATIRSLKAEGITVLLSSHLLPQVQAICDRVGLFNRGKLAIEGTVADLARRVLGGAYRVQLEAEGPLELEDRLRTIDGVVGLTRLAPNTFAIESASDMRAELARTVVETGGRLLALNTETPNLDEIYTRYFKEVEHVVAA